MLKVDGHIDLYRDESTKAIINTNSSEYSKYKSQQEFRLTQNQELLDLKSEVSEMKLLINMLLDKSEK